MKKNNLIHARTCVYNINYHLVWSMKYRRKILNEAIEKRLKEIFRDIAEEKGFIVHMIEVGELGSIHAFVSAHPKVAPSYMVKMLKGISARKLFLEFPHIKQYLWKGRLWNSSFYIETVGSISEDAIQKYIANQSKRG
ncbi:IS200/IS605 family transposase [Lentibacillus sp. CBA3610]|uniref:IS200/IS605 family transposase n=1 Tax=Lentibacillus sp. CBA3610 TaxID=2518176 RepID=UPI0015958653|nr:IS200/IS605 family transposase [Lentibacillus sp. CBA3610]QKY70744.1 IS200/IS605 family transposase [Lentibacillus sp. CBA3610]